MNNKLSKLISYTTLGAYLIGAGCTSDRECFGSFEQKILSWAPSSKEKQREMKEAAESIPYSSFNEVEKTVYENMLKVKKERSIRKKDFTDFEWESLKRYYGLKSPNEVTPREYILLMRIVGKIGCSFGFK